MRFSLVVDTDNAAFFDADGEPAPCWELAAILRTVANHLESAEDLAPLESEPLFDSNGNRCGKISTTYQPPRGRRAHPRGALVFVWSNDLTTYNRFLWEGQSYPILSDNRAMAAPSWSLPAAITCPGMLADSDNAICAGCYAQLGRYATRTVAEPQAARLAWMLANLDEPTDWIRQVVDALRAANCLYVRLHDSGDWFSVAQCRAWYEICRRTPDQRYWSPTRSWRVPHLLPELRRLHSLPNVTIRPSALHFDAPAPVVEGLGAGMASHYRDTPNGRTCPKTEAGSCAAARCRACWDNDDGPVSFLAHGQGGTHRPTPPSATQRKARLGIVREFVPLESVLGVIRADAGRANG